MLIYIIICCVYLFSLQKVYYKLSECKLKDAVLPTQRNCSDTQLIKVIEFISELSLRFCSLVVKISFSIWNQPEAWSLAQINQYHLEIRCQKVVPFALYATTLGHNSYWLAYLFSL